MSRSQKVQAWLVLGIGLLGLAAIALVWLRPNGRDNTADAAPPAQKNPFNGERAYGYLKKLCDLGPRPSGSAGMKRQQEMLEEHFQNLGAEVERQEFQVRHPQTGQPVAMANLIVRWHPETRERLLLAAHYDTRPYPDRDPKNPQGRFIGANDGASGTALLMELGNDLPSLKTKLGIDFVLFDGEEYVFREGDRYFLGSEHFATQYVQQRPKHRYGYAVLLDMVGDADLRIYHEANSWSWGGESRRLIADIWGTARRLQIKEFVPERKHEVRDDHLALHDIAKIPSCDIIDFDYPYWHTEGDVPDRCSAESLAKVGWVIREWIQTAK